MGDVCASTFVEKLVNRNKTWRFEAWLRGTLDRLQVSALFGSLCFILLLMRLMIPDRSVTHDTNKVQRLAS